MDCALVPHLTNRNRVRNRAFSRSERPTQTAARDATLFPDETRRIDARAGLHRGVGGRSVMSARFIRGGRAARVPVHAGGRHGLLGQGARRQRLDREQRHLGIRRQVARITAATTTTYVRRYPYFPRFVPHENPPSTPYDDFTDSGNPRSDRSCSGARRLAPQLTFASRSGAPYSVMKNRWVKMWRVVGGKTRTCYGQVEDAGPYVYDDMHYVFSRTNARPASSEAQNAGMDVSPAIRDCLAFSGLNNADNKLSWRFVEAAAVPPGPWRRVVTTRQVYWP